MVMVVVMVMVIVMLILIGVVVVMVIVKAMGRSERGVRRDTRGNAGQENVTTV
jgi:heme/copper-type cytochrome/quinol oxidase subunit 2